MRRRLSIYVDVDDVLADATAALIEIARDRFGRDVEFESCSSFDLGESFGLSPEERDRLLDAAHEDRVVESMPAIEGAAPVLTGWETDGHEVHVVTGRPPSTLAATRRWLDRMQMPYSSVTSVDKYARQAHLPDAVPLDRLRERPFEVAVEDSASMARHLSADLGVPVLLFDRPWNRTVEARGGRIQRVHSWSEIAEVVRRRSIGPRTAEVGDGRKKVLPG